MHVAVVAGPDPGHAFPAFRLAQLLQRCGHSAVVYTGSRWFALADMLDIKAQELPGLALDPHEPDVDAGRRMHQRAGSMARLLAPRLSADLPDVVVSDVLTAAGGLAAELLRVPWAELSPHPLYRQSRFLPPIGAGMVAGSGLRGVARDSLLRCISGRAVQRGVRQRAEVRAALGLTRVDPGPVLRLIATMPFLEIARPDWPREAHLVGPLLLEPTERLCQVPSGSDPLVVIAPSTARTGVADMVQQSLQALDPACLGRRVRVFLSGLTPDIGGSLPEWAAVGFGRQDLLLAHAQVAICGAGHGFLSKSLLAGVPVVAIPGGGDQWELANRVSRRGAGQVVRPVESAAITAAVARILNDRSFVDAAGVAARSAVHVADPVKLIECV